MKLSLEDLQPGMTLAAALLDDGGRLLLPAGTPLTEKHLRCFQMWGIAEADVEGDERVCERDELVEPARLVAAAAEVRSLFRHADLDHPVINQLYRHCVATVAGGQLRRSA